MADFEFPLFSIVRHMVTRDVYIILETPREEKRLERSNDPYYAYARVAGPDKTIWLRAQMEMEQRFILEALR